jgi:hypothetical protein
MAATAEGGAPSATNGALGRPLRRTGTIRDQDRRRGEENGEPPHRADAQSLRRIAGVTTGEPGAFAAMR